MTRGSHVLVCGCWDSDHRRQRHPLLRQIQAWIYCTATLAQGFLPCSHPPLLSSFASPTDAAGGDRRIRAYAALIRLRPPRIWTHPSL
jgi:hypothetical protein